MGIKKAFSLVKRITRWYLAPSGLLLVVALVLLGVGFAVTDLGRWFGLAGVAVLAIFLPYRFARQQGWADRHIHSATMVARTANHNSNLEIAKVNGSLATLENNVAVAKANVDDTNDLLVVLRGAVATLDEQVTIVDRRSAEAGEVARTAAQAAAATQNLHGDVAALRSRLVDRIAQLEADRDGVRALSARVQQIEADRAESRDVSTQISKLRADVDSLTSSPTPPADNRIDTSIASMHESLASLRQQLNEVAAQVRTADDRTTEIERSTSGFAERLDSLREGMTNENRRAFVRLGPQLDDYSGVIVLLAPERSGSTWVFDVLRNLPGCSALPTNDLYEVLQARGNRYPGHLLDSSNTGLPFEVNPGRVALLPDLLPDLRAGKSRIAVEKVHPSALDFDVLRIDQAMQTLRDAGKTVHIVVLVRQPVDSLRSFSAYQSRAGWHADVRPEQALSLYEESFRMMEAVVERQAGSCSVAVYSELASPSAEALHRSALAAGIKSDLTDVVAAKAAVERWQATQGDNPFFGPTQRRSGAQVVLSHSADQAQTEKLAAVREAFLRLVARRDATDQL